MNLKLMKIVDRNPPFWYMLGLNFQSLCCFNSYYFTTLLYLAHMHHPA